MILKNSFIYNLKDINLKNKCLDIKLFNKKVLQKRHICATFYLDTFRDAKGGNNELY